MKHTLFVTVGTTQFPELIESIHCSEFYNLALKHGFTHVIIQHGAHPLPKATLPASLTVTHFDFKPSLEEYFASADFIISHAGTGSVLEALSNQKRLLVVVNARLMDNHQQELAQELAQQKFLQMTQIEGFSNAFVRAVDDKNACIPWTPDVSGSRAWIQLIKKELLLF